LNGVMRIAAILLAAGAGQRMGGPKALADVGGRSFLEAAAARFERGDLTSPIVVLGAEAARVAACVPLPAGSRVVVNDRYQDGMLTSVWAGLDAAEACAVDAVLLHPVDNPLVAEATVSAVIKALAAGAVIAAPSHAGRRGHPAGFARAAWPALRAAPPAAGARAVLAAHPDWVVHVPAGADCLVDLDTPGALADALGGSGTAPPAR
jgi:nicotine blue oxidoreductase